MDIKTEHNQITHRCCLHYGSVWSGASLCEDGAHSCPSSFLLSTAHDHPVFAEAPGWCVLSAQMIVKQCYTNTPQGPKINTSITGINIAELSSTDVAQYFTLTLSQRFLQKPRNITNELWWKLEFWTQRMIQGAANKGPPAWATWGKWCSQRAKDAQVPAAFSATSYLHAALFSPLVKEEWLSELANVLLEVMRKRRHI